MTDDASESRNENRRFTFAREMVHVAGSVGQSLHHADQRAGPQDRPHRRETARLAPLPARARGAGASPGYSVWFALEDDAPRRMSEAAKQKIRRNNLKRRLDRKLPLFADQLYLQETSDRPDYFGSEPAR